MFLFMLFVFVCIVVFNTYLLGFFILFSSSCVPYVASFSGLFIFDCPFRILKLLFRTRY